MRPEPRQKGEDSYPTPTATVNGKAVPVKNLRCPDCNKLLAELVTPPFRLRCPRCKEPVAQA